MVSKVFARRVAVAALTVAVVVVLAGCGSSSSKSSSSASSKGLQTVNVNLIPIADTAAVYVGQKEGFFARHGLALKITLSPSGGPAIVPSLVSGADQFGAPAYSDLILAVAKKLPLVSIATGDSAGPTNNTDYQYLVSLKSSGISSLKQLEGKTVAINSLKGLGEVQVDEAMRKVGANYKTVHFVAINFPQMAAALTAHRVEAAQIVEPFYTELKSETPVNTLVGLDYAIAPSLPVLTMMTTKSYYEKDHATVVKFQEAMEEAVKYTSTHLSVARSVLPSYTGMSASLSSKILMPHFPAITDTEGIQQMETDMKEFGIISNAPPLSSFVKNGEGS